MNSYRQTSLRQEGNSIQSKEYLNALKMRQMVFNCSYRLGALYVKQKEEELWLKRTDGYIPREYHPSEAQAVDFYENSKFHHEAKYLVLNFPFSNGGFLQLNHRESMGCFLEDLVSIFGYIGGIPIEI